MTQRYELIRTTEGKMVMVEVKKNKPDSKKNIKYHSNEDIFSFKNIEKKKYPKFCIFCKKAGFQCDDHFMRKNGYDDGEIVCEKILNSVCTICYQKGHTKSYCQFKNLNQSHSTNNGCAYCLSLSIPARIASLHQTYEDESYSLVKKITCPLLYAHSFDLDKEDNSFDLNKEDNSFDLNKEDNSFDLNKEDNSFEQDKELSSNGTDSVMDDDDSDNFIIPKISDEPNMSIGSPRSPRSQQNSQFTYDSYLYSSQESNATTVDSYRSLDYSEY
jgi:hypothetical protein